MNIGYEEEVRLVRGILTASDFPEEDAEIIAKVIAHSDFTGVYSHGLSRLTRYLRQIKAGSLNNKPRFEKLLDSGAVLVIWWRWSAATPMPSPRLSAGLTGSSARTPSSWAFRRGRSIPS